MPVIDPSDPISDIKARLERRRQRLTPEEQRIFDEHGRPSKFHDLLVIGPTNPDELTRVPVVKTERSLDGHGNVEPAGSYVDEPEKWDQYDYGYRRTLSIARPQEWSPAPNAVRGPAFGTLPVKREPASTACVACYLINAQNFIHHNAWTAEEWNDIGSDDLQPASSADDDRFELLVAGPRGKVFYLDVRLADGEGADLWPVDGPPVALDGRGSFKSVDLRYESEIWNQLRNGLVAGSVMTRFQRADRDATTPVPIVNVTSMLLDPEPVQAAPDASGAASREA